MTNEQLAYAAGVIDGEGCIGAYSQGAHQGRGNLCLQLTVANTDIRMLLFLSDLWGGKIITLNRKNMKRLLYEWRKVGREAGQTLRDVLPYLIVKQEQATLAIEFADTIGETWASRKNIPRGTSCLTDETISRRHAIALELKSLKVA